MTLKKKIFWSNCFPFYSCKAAEWSYFAVLFLQFKEFELYWGPVLRSVHTFSWFLKSNYSSDFGHAETGSEAKKRVAFRREIFCPYFEVEWEHGVWRKIRFVVSGFLFTCGNFTLIFYFFFDFLDRIFFLKGFHNPFVVRSLSSFLSSQCKFFELYIRTCHAMFLTSSNKNFSLYLSSQLVQHFFCFVVWRSFSFYICSHSKAEEVRFSEWLLPLTNSLCARDVISHSLKEKFFAWLKFDHKWLTSLNKNDFRTLKVKFNVNFLMVKGTHICSKGP